MLPLTVKLAIGVVPPIALLKVTLPVVLAVKAKLPLIVFEKVRLPLVLLTVVAAVNVIGPDKVKLLLPDVATLPFNAIEPVPDVCTVVGKLNVTALSVTAAVPVLLPNVKLLKVLANADKSVELICNVPVPPATPTVVASDACCNVTAPVPVIEPAPPLNVIPLLITVKFLVLAATAATVTLPDVPVVNVAFAVNAAGPAKVILPAPLAVTLPSNV